MTSGPLKKIIITAAVHPSLIERLEVHGFQVDYVPDILYEDLLVKVPEAEGLVVTTRVRIDKAMIQAGEKLKWIGRLGSGMELIDTAFAGQRGIRCFSTPEGNMNAVGEHTLALLLNLMNNISKSFNEVQQGQWLRNANRGTELTGKTIGIVGYGNTGKSFARLLQPFGVTIMGYDKYKDGFGGGVVKEANLEHIFRYADVVSMHVPLTEETRHMANDSFFNSLQQCPFYITTCRGPVTHTTALVNALKSGKIAGAALDVLENEKINALSHTEREEFHFLTTQPNVIITPHIAGYSNEAFLRMADILLQKLAV